MGARACVLVWARRGSRRVGWAHFRRGLPGPMYQWLLGALGALLAAARRPAPAPPPRKRPSPSVQPPLEDLDEVSPKKPKSDDSNSEHKEEVREVSAVVKLPAKKRKKRHASPRAVSRKETSSTSSDRSSKRSRGSALEIEMLQIDKMPCGTTTCLNKDVLFPSPKTVPFLSTNRSDKHHIKPSLGSTLTLKPPVREHTVPESTASEVSKMGRIFCAAEEDVQREEKEKYKQLLQLVKEKYPGSRPNPQLTSFRNVQASKEPVMTASHLDGKKRGDVSPRMTLRTSINYADVCSPLSSQQSDTIRHYTPAQNSHEEGRPAKQAIARRLCGAETSEEMFFQLQLSPVLSGKPPGLDVGENTFASSGKTESFSPLTEAMEREIAAALGKGHPDEVLSSAFKLKVTREDIQTLKNLHWLNDEVIDIRKKTITYFDSLGQKGDEICHTLFQYLQEESQEKRNLELNFSEWTLHSMESHEIPQQLNGSDCGVFVCKYADYVSRDKLITFTQSHMPYFRKKMVWEIIHQQLL